MIDPDKEREDLISIRQLVALIAQTTGKTEQQAAAVVSANLIRNPAWNALTLCDWQPAFGCTKPSRQEEEKVMQRLVRWGNTGNSSPGFEDLDDDIPF